MYCTVLATSTALLLFQCVYVYQGARHPELAWLCVSCCPVFVGFLVVVRAAKRTMLAASENMPAADLVLAGLLYAALARVCCHCRPTEAVNGRRILSICTVAFKQPRERLLAGVG